MDAHQVNMYEAKTNFSKLVAEVECGGEIVIARDGKPVARLVPYEPHQRQAGTAKGEIRMADDFDDPLPENMLEGLAP